MLISSQSTQSEIVLKKGFKTHVSVFRLLPVHLSAKLFFDVTKGVAYPEHGDWSSILRREGRETIEFKDPGANLLISFSNSKSGKNILYETLPMHGRGRDSLTRSLMPFINDNNPTGFAWYGSDLKHLLIPAGFSDIEIEITDVGFFPANNKATLMVEAPLTFKTSQDGYGLLWWFFLWPIYAGVLAFYGLILIWFSYYKPKNV